MFLDSFIRYIQFQKKYSLHTLSSYKKDLSNYLHFIESKGLTVEQADHQVVRAYVAQLLSLEMQPRSVNKCLSTLRSFYKFLLREELVQKNPMLLVRNLKTPKNLPVFIDEKRLAALFDEPGRFEDSFAGKRDRLILEILFGTGIRRAELLTIKASDIDFFNSTIRIFGKGKKERILPLHSTLVDLLKDYLHLKQKVFEKKETEHLIVNDRGEAATEYLVYRTVTFYLSQISTQMKVSPHVLRHSFATALLNRGASINDIKELLGHASLAATQIYAHSSVEKLKSIYKLAHPKA